MTHKSRQNNRDKGSKNSQKGVKKSHTRRGSETGHFHHLGNSTGNSGCKVCRPDISRKLATKKEIRDIKLIVNSNKKIKGNYYVDF